MATGSGVSAVNAPVSTSELERPPRKLMDAPALCLSGGGYRAMLFHCGALLRMNEVGLLPHVKRISSVSGGSIVAGVLGMNWKRMQFAGGQAVDFEEKVVEPVRSLASRTLDAGAILGGLMLPGTIGDKVADAYDEYLFRGAKLTDLPTDAEGPRIVINATSVQTGALWRFSRPYMGDYLVGRVENPDVLLAQAVAASSAFPPVLSPVELNLKRFRFKKDPTCKLQSAPFTEEAVLSDGGVYDNLGLETVWKRFTIVLVSDGGGKMEAEGAPKHDWGRHSIRVLNIIDNQVRSLRKRLLLDSYRAPAGPQKREGAFWGIRTDYDDYDVKPALPCPHKKTLALAEIETRLKRVSTEEQNRLMNWGYAVCDAALRRYVGKLLSSRYGITLAAPTRFPFKGGVG